MIKLVTYDTRSGVGVMFAAIKVIMLKLSLKCALASLSLTKPLAFSTERVLNKNPIIPVIQGEQKHILLPGIYVGNYFEREGLDKG